MRRPPPTPKKGEVMGGPLTSYFSPELKLLRRFNFNRYTPDGILDGWFAMTLRASTFGPPTNHFLSDVVREVGPERFEEFWTSDLPVDEAFASIVGRDIGEWTSDWLAAEIGRYHFGPGVRAGEVFVVILLAGIGALAGAYVAEKRKTG